MTLQEYIDNPMGKGDASLGQNRLVTLNLLKQKYEILTKSKRIKMHCYISSLSGTYFIHLIIPSESERDNTYDVVFEFTDNPKSENKKSLSGHNVRVFSNSPSFAYTFAYVYKKHNLMIDSLIKKLGKDFVKIAPEVRNRYQIVNYEKYVFFGAMYIRESGILNLDKFVSKASKTMTRTFPGKVRSLEEIMKEYDIASAKIRKAKKREQVQKQREVKKEKKEIQQIKSGINTIKPMKKDTRHMTSSIKKVKSIGGSKHK